MARKTTQGGEGGEGGDAGRTGDDNGRFVEALLWIGRTGAPWRDLPLAFGKWRRVYATG